MSQLLGTRMSAKRETRIASILDCAEKNFVEKGFHGAGISGIARDCGISVGHLYHYFPSKDSLVEAVTERELCRQLERMREFENDTPQMVQEGIVSTISDIIMRKEDPFRTVLNFEILAEAQRNPSVAHILQKHDAVMRQEFSAILERAGLDSIQLRTELLFTMFSGLPARALRHPEQERASFLETMKPVLESILGDCWDGDPKKPK
ncbi:MAG: TetR/AcrR family transcriptional regulator [Alphaproteobacteria bacterium]|nr:hypothetical protein [Hyphomonas sp.]MBR9807304.1 TetR/AcrR family transcriptional regulator [Alphaproteobacteria bacterium]